jgi:hypothetical protein
MLGRIFPLMEMVHFYLCLHTNGKIKIESDTQCKICRNYWETPFVVNSRWKVCNAEFLCFSLCHFFSAQVKDVLQGGHVGNELGCQCNMGAKFNITELVVHKLNQSRNDKFTATLCSSVAYAQVSGRPKIMHTSKLIPLMLISNVLWHLVVVAVTPATLTLTLAIGCPSFSNLLNVWLLVCQ